MKNYYKLGISTIIAFAITGTAVFATTGKVYNTSQGLVLRGSASKSGAPLATVADGAEVEIVEKDGEWYKVNANGQEGYLFAEYVKVEEETPAEDINLTDNANTNTASSETKMHILPAISSTTISTMPAEGQYNVEREVGNWKYITYENMHGWIRVPKNNETVETESVEEETEVEEEQEQQEPEQQETQEEQTTITPQEDTNVSFRKGYINASSVNVRKGPSKSTEVITTLVLNTGVTITAQTDEWYRIVYGDYMGYIYKTLISETPVATSRSTETRTPEAETTTQTQATEPSSTPQPVSTTSSAEGERIVAFAKQYLGYSYVYGGTTPSGGFDCSGFVYYVFNSCGYSLSRSCTVQAQSGTAVSRGELQPGDILFFNNTSNGAIGHTGIYIGDGRFIHAANPRRGVVTDTINSGYYNTYYYSARRVAN